MKKRRRQSGFNETVDPLKGLGGRPGGLSLVELLVALGIGLAIVVAMYNVFTLQNKTFAHQEQVVEMQQNVRAAMDMMSREVRMAGYDPCGLNTDADPHNNFFGITVDGAQLQIKADLNGRTPLGNDCQAPYRGIDASSQENVIYAYDAANKKITRAIGAGAQSFAENVAGFSFAYLDAGGNVTASSTAVRQIRLTITGRTAKPDPAYAANGSYRTYTLTSLIAMRN